MIRWCYVVSYTDHASGVSCVERFLFPADANERCKQLRAAGFRDVRKEERRVRAVGAPANTRPGRYGD